MTRGRIWTDGDTASVRNLALLGRSDTEIARILGFTRETVCRRRNTLGIGPLDSEIARQIAKERGQFGGLRNSRKRNPR